MTAPDRPAPTPPADADPLGRDTLGRVVREAWVQWARIQPNPKPSWLVPYDELSEPDKEADRQIGEEVMRYVDAVRLNQRLDRVEKRLKSTRPRQSYGASSDGYWSAE